MLLADLDLEQSLLRELAAKAGRAPQEVGEALEPFVHDRGDGGPRRSPCITRRLQELVLRTEQARDPWRALVGEILWDSDDELVQVLRALGIDIAAAAPEPPRAIPRVARVASEATSSWPDFCRDMTLQAESGTYEPRIGRSAELDELVEVLSLWGSKNALLLGEPGVGKTALVEELARRSARGEIPRLRGVAFVELQLGGLIAGTQYRGAFEERIRELLTRLEQSSRETILFLDEFHLAVGAGKAQEGPDLANLLKPALGGRRIRVIAATTESEYRRHVEPDEALVRRFVAITVREPSPEETLTILEHAVGRYEAHHGVRYDRDVLRGVIELADRHLQQLRFPAKALQLLDRAGARASLSGPASIDARRPVELSHVAEVVASRCRAPIARLARDGQAMRARAHSLLEARLLGQSDVLHTLVDAVSSAVARAARTPRPLLALHVPDDACSRGYDVASALAEVLAGDDRRVVRVDGTQLTSAHDCERLIGPSPGLVGYEQGGILLTEPVRRDPHAVVILENPDAAHADALGVFESVLDHGHLVDNHGRTVRFDETSVLVLAPARARTPRLERLVRRCSATLAFVPLDESVAVAFVAEVLLRETAIFLGRPTPIRSLAWSERAGVHARAVFEKLRHLPDELASWTRVELVPALVRALACQSASSTTIDFDADGRWCAVPSPMERES